MLVANRIQTPNTAGNTRLWTVDYYCMDGRTNSTPKDNAARLQCGLPGLLQPQKGSRLRLSGRGGARVGFDARTCALLLIPVHVHVHVRTGLDRAKSPVFSISYLSSCLLLSPRPALSQFHLPTIFNLCLKLSSTHP